MKVADVMMRTPASCRAETNLAAAVEILWNRNCGMLPVVDGEGKVTGVITDRDICIALGTRNQTAADVTVGQVAPQKVFACKPDDDIHSALAVISDAKVRRLPVVDGDGKLQGILSMDDVVLHASSSFVGRGAGLANNDVVEYMKRIYRADLPEVVHREAAIA